MLREGPELYEIFIIYLALSSNILIIFLIIFFSPKMSSKIIEIDDNNYGQKWYKYPKSIKIYILLLIQNTQQPKHLTEHNLFYCNLEIFKRVNIFLFFCIYFVIVFVSLFYYRWQKRQYLIIWCSKVSHRSFDLEQNRRK